MLKSNVWNRKVEEELVFYLWEEELQELINNEMVTYRPDLEEWLYLGEPELLKQLKKEKLVPNYVESFSMKIVQNKSFGFTNKKSYKMHFYFNRKCKQY